MPPSASTRASVFRVVCGKLDEREFGRAGDRGALAKSASPPIMNLGGMVDLDAVHSGAMTVPTEAPAPPAAPASPLDDVLRRVNRIRTAHGADPLYELPAACTAWEGGGCVLERAFEDLGVLIVDYERDTAGTSSSSTASVTSPATSTQAATRSFSPAGERAPCRDGQRPRGAPSCLNSCPPQLARVLQIAQSSAAADSRGVPPARAGEAEALLRDPSELIASRPSRTIEKATVPSRHEAQRSRPPPAPDGRWQARRLLARGRIGLDPAPFRSAGACATLASERPRVPSAPRRERRPC